MDIKKDKCNLDNDKVLPIPDSQLVGRDTDKAYNQNGDFGKRTEERKEGFSDIPEGGDADG